jgi:acyl-CoA synthetase (AMP-forming)/AMP-acid ligase II
MSFTGTITAFIWSHFYVGGTVVMASGLAVPEQLTVLQRERGTYMYLPTPSMDEFADEVRRRPDTIASLVSILHSGSKAPRGKVEKVCEVIGHRYLEGYGQTEISGGLLCATTASDSLGISAARDVFASGGRPGIDAVVEVLDPDGKPLPHDGVSQGELVYMSPALMTGYWRNERATEAGHRGEWFASGDIAAIDEAGYIYVIDRRNDLIVSGGANVSPLEVEEVILSHPAVAECVVVPAEHERWGHMVVAVVVPHPGQALREEVVTDYCRTRLASYKIPKRVLITDGFHYSASHKVRRFEVRDWVAEQLAGGR